MDEQIAAVDAGPDSGGGVEELRVERYEVQLKDALTGEILGFGGGDTPDQAAARAIADARVSGELNEDLARNDDGVRD